MLEHWKIYKLGEVADIQNGFAFKSTDMGETGIPVIKIKNIVSPDVILEGAGYYTGEIDPKLEKYILRRDDFLISMTGSTVNVMSSAVGKMGKYRLDDIALINQRVGKIYITDKSKADFDYVCHFLNRYEINYNLALNATGSANQANISPAQIKDIDILLPPLDEQQAIASILSAIDDKIELNIQMNKTLEEMAMTLYKHWFVDFGPFQDGEFVDSELGMIPKGWDVLPLSDVTSKITDGAHHSPKTVENGMPMASVKDMDSWGFNLETCRQICVEDYFKLTAQGCRPLKGDVVIAKDGSYLKHSFIVEKDLYIVLLSSIAILKPNGKLNPQLLNLYLKLDSVKERMKTIVSGAAIQRIVLKEFRNFLTIVPPLQIQEKALESIEGLIHNCWNNINETQTLITLRNTILPKLISGEVRVKEAEKALAEVL